MTFGSEIGKVIWFDRKKGYGFVKVINPDSEFFNKDVFVHYTSISCRSNFKILYPGECVSLDIKKNTEEEGKKEFSTSNISGIFGTQLMVDNEDFIIKIINKKKNNLSNDNTTEEEVNVE